MEAQVLIERWRHQYNTFRPPSHSSKQNGEFTGTFDSGVIPEPSTALLLACGLVALAAGRRWR